MKSIQIPAHLISQTSVAYNEGVRAARDRRSHIGGNPYRLFKTQAEESRMWLKGYDDFRTWEKATKSTTTGRV